jgi:pimeloyl-ACP methyl ester carboxylesterase
MTQVQQVQKQPESKWIEANGVRLHYVDWGGSGGSGVSGAKQPLLLVHGLQDCAFGTSSLITPIYYSLDHAAMG